MRAGGTTSMAINGTPPDLIQATGHYYKMSSCFLSLELQSYYNSLLFATQSALLYGHMVLWSG